MKKLVIIKPNCREFANHLWNYLNIYAYGLETGVRVYNPSFFEWHRHFNLDKKELFATKIFSAFPVFASVWRFFLYLYGSYVVRARAQCVLLTLGITMSLPPTRPLIARGDTCKTTYFIGWHFRNPVGLERHRDALIASFMPKERVLKKIKDTIAPFQKKRLIGVHLRKQPYKGFEDGSFLIPIPRVRQIIDEYLQEKKLSAEDVVLVIVSDKSVDATAFEGFTTHIRLGNDVTALFLLSKCSVVIGTNSTFSSLAAWFGNVPHVITTNESIDWEYYRNTTAYFENKYATFAQ
jgi:hypothetical protein